MIKLKCNIYSFRPTKYLSPRPGRIAEQVSSTWNYFHPDALGSVRQLSDSTGSLTLGQSIEPYGDLLKSAGTGSTSYGRNQALADIIRGILEHERGILP